MSPRRKYRSISYCDTAPKFREKIMIHYKLKMAKQNQTIPKAEIREKEMQSTKENEKQDSPSE